MASTSTCVWKKPNIIHPGGKVISVGEGGRKELVGILDDYQESERN